MTLRADRVREVSNVIGVGSYTLDGAVVGFRRFSAALANGSRCYYCATAGLDWEVGQGALLSAGILARQRVVASTNANSLVSWGAGTKQIFLTAAAETQLPRCNTAAAGPPGVSDDETLGYAQGSVWVSNANAWVCLDQTEGAAVWQPIASTPATLGDTEISGLPAADPLLDADLVAVSQAGDTNQATLEELRNFFSTIPVLVESGTSRTLGLTDANTVIRCTNASGCAVELPSDSTLAVPIGTTIGFVQENTGQVVLTAGAGATMQVEATFLATSNETSALIFVVKTQANTWLVSGSRAFA